MDLPLPPRLTRQHATFVEVKSDPKSVALCAQIVKAYHNLPFRGPVLELIPGVIAVHDMWEANLKDELMDRTEFGTVEQFSLEVWLKEKVEREGTADQRQRFAALLDSLAPDEPDEPVYGLPDDVLDVVQQPLVEVSAYRNFDDITVDDVDDATDDGERPAEAGLETANPLPEEQHENDN
mmetsp:Transcript_28154/g.90761  ORF Transcript_28154/g.90761 Transcript_28154/m.90761 type:complete len:180 (+) Transcript_28154:99-638(+)